MAVLLNGGEGLTTTLTTNGATIPAGTGETVMTAAITTGGSLAPDTTTRAHGTQSVKITPVATGPVYARSASSGGVATAACDMLIRVPGLTAPATGSEPFLLQAVGVGGGTLYSATWVPTSGFLRQRDGSGAATTSSTAFNPSAVFLRLAMYVSINTATPASSTCHIAAYPLDSNTVSIDLGTLAKTPATSGVLIDYFKFGRANTDTDTTIFYADDMRWDYAATDLIPATAVTPTVTAAVSPGSADTGVLRTLTLSLANGNGNAVTWGPVTWEGTTDTAVTTAAGVTSKTFTRTPTTAGLGKSGSYAWSQA